MGIFFCVGMLILSNLFLPCFADDNTVIAQIEKLDLPRNNIISYILRPAGWVMLKGLAFLVNCMSGAIYQINSAASGVFTNRQIVALMKKVIGIAAVLLTLVIVYIGIQFITKPQKIGTVMTNFIVGFLLFVSLPTLVMGAYNLTEAAISSIGANSLASLGNQVLSSNVIDVTFYDTNGFNADLAKKNLYTSNVDGIRNIDPIEMVDGSEDQKMDGCVKIKNKDFWCKRVITDSSGNKSLTNLWDGMQAGAVIGSKLFSEFYYRYKIDWFNAFITLIVTGLALILSGIKIARILFELIVKQTLAQVVGLLDIHTGQRLKQCLQSLLSSFVGLFGCMLMLQVYTIGTAAVVNNVTNPYVKIILEIAMAWMVIDGPDIFEKVFGMDVGMKHPMAAMYGINTAAQGLKGAAQAITGNKNYTAPDENGHVRTYHTGGLFGKHGAVDNVVNGAVGAASMAAGGAGLIGGHFAGKKGTKNGFDAEFPQNRNQPQSQQSPNGGAEDTSAATAKASETDSPQNESETTSGIYTPNAENNGQTKGKANVKPHETVRGLQSPQTSANVQNGHFTGPSSVSMYTPPTHRKNAAPFSGGTHQDRGGSFAQNEYAAEHGSSYAGGSGFAQNEYAAEQSARNESDISESSAGSTEQPSSNKQGMPDFHDFTTSEYLKYKISNAAQNSRFARPKQAYSLYYDLSKNSAMKHSAAKHTKPMDKNE